MNVHELPMITFTVLAQMAVGAFVVLGIINLAARATGRYSTADLDEISNPASYAIGATLILGLGASMLHMNDPLHVLNVFRHVDSSWLSREIVTGMGFSGFGFLYAACQFLKWGSAGFRQVLALVTALIGIVFLYSMSMVYYSVVTVPAWNTWVTPARFATTALILGAFAIGTAFMTVVMYRRDAAEVGRASGLVTGAATRAQRSFRKPLESGAATTLLARRRADTAAHDEGYSPRARALILASLRGIAIAGIILLAIEFILQPVHLMNLMNAGAAGIESANAFSGALGIVRIILVCLGAGLLSLFLFRIASSSAASPRPVAMVVTLAFACVLVAEFLGRAAFYEQMTRIGM